MAPTTAPTAATSKNKKRKKRSSTPLAPPPQTKIMKSRKKARQVTTLFHKYTREKDMALQQGATPEILAQYDQKIKDIGGREAYQRASQLSTSFHSTSKWVLGVLQRNGWLYGRTPTTNDASEQEETSPSIPAITNNSKTQKRKLTRRTTRLLEVGAINTELLDAADRRISDATTNDNNDSNDNNNLQKKKYRLSVRAIDLNSMHPGRIEQADFLKLPLPTTKQPHQQRYDVVVCSMVLNCVTTAADRGEMLARLYHFLLPGGLCFLTIPKLCLTQSPYMDRERFLQLLGATGIGFAVMETKESPKLSFFLCQRPANEQEEDEKDASNNSKQKLFDAQKWSTLKKIYRGKKYRNQFAITLDEKSVLHSK